MNLICPKVTALVELNTVEYDKFSVQSECSPGNDPKIFILYVLGVIIGTNCDIFHLSATKTHWFVKLITIQNQFMTKDMNKHFSQFHRSFWKLTLTSNLWCRSMKTFCYYTICILRNNLVYWTQFYHPLCSAVDFGAIQISECSAVLQFVYYSGCPKLFRIVVKWISLQ